MRKKVFLKWKTNTAFSLDGTITRVIFLILVQFDGIFDIFGFFIPFYSVISIFLKFKVISPNSDVSL